MKKSGFVIWQEEKLAQWEAWFPAQSLSTRKAVRAVQGFVVSLLFVLAMGYLVSFMRGVASPDDPALVWVRENPVGQALLWAWSWVWSLRWALLLLPFYGAWEAAREEEKRDRQEQRRAHALSWKAPDEAKEAYDQKAKLGDYF